MRLMSSSFEPRTCRSPSFHLTLVKFTRKRQMSKLPLSSVLEKDLLSTPNTLFQVLFIFCTLYSCEIRRWPFAKRICQVFFVNSFFRLANTWRSTMTIAR